MNRFECECNSTVYFESRVCLSCNVKIAFDPETLSFRKLNQALETTVSCSDTQAETQQKVLCSNGKHYDVCNWLAAPDAVQGLCPGCQFNRYIPNLDSPKNVRRWGVLETAKKRLLLTLTQMGLPYATGWQAPEQGFLFDFLEDQRDNPDVSTPMVYTGYADGIITINLLEASTTSRIAQQKAAKESYRTVLGHMRHESGHHFWTFVKKDSGLLEEFKQRFGLENEDYAIALKQFYECGPCDAWSERFISPYASAHPLEDWAECWAHYLHIYDGLETAAALGMAPINPAELCFQEKITLWRSVSAGLNEMNRSLGLQDAYPFVINTTVAEKLGFVDRVVTHLQTLDLGSAIGQTPF